VTKLRYGPRFGQSGFSASWPYNEVDDHRMQKGFAMFAALANQAQYKKELRYYKTAKATRKAAAKKADGPEREEAELRMADAVRKCVEILEFHMEALTQHRKVANRPHYVAQMQIHNVIVELRNKCGVSFSEHNPHYAERLCEDQRRRDGDVKGRTEYMRDDREQQRLARLRHAREMAVRLALKHNQGIK
jgi:hypothetical protein